VNFVGGVRGISAYADAIESFDDSLFGLASIESAKTLHVLKAKNLWTCLIDVVQDMREDFAPATVVVEALTSPSRAKRLAWKTGDV